MSVEMEKERKSAVARGWEMGEAVACRMMEGWEEKAPWVEMWKMEGDSWVREMRRSEMEPEAW